MPQPERFALYGFWRSSAVYRVRVALALKGLTAEERFVDLDSGGQHDPAFLAINPLGGVPALIDQAAGDGAGAMTQSLAILEFLEETHPSPNLLPADPAGRARVRGLAAMMAVDTHPLVTPRIRKYLTGAGRFDAADWRAWQVHWFTTGLQAIEARLTAEAATGDFCHGDAVSLADICLASIIVVMRVFKITVADIPTVERIMARCEAIPAFANAAPARQQGAPA